MCTIAFRFDLSHFSNHRKKMLEFDTGNVLKEFETFIFDENSLKTAGYSDMYLQCVFFGDRIWEGCGFNISWR